MRQMTVAVLFIAMSAAAQEAAQDPLAYYIETAKPVAEHARLAELSGPWKVASKLWFGPGDPQISTGTGSGRMILGGRFLELTATTKGALDSEHVTIYGFDRRTSDYTLVGMDTLGTYYITAAGKYDQAEKGIVLHGSYAQPPSMKETKYRFVWTKPGEKEHLFTLFFTMTDGKEMRVAETRFTRE